MFAIDWNEWQTDWRHWMREHESMLRRGTHNFGPKHFLADEVLGSWRIYGREVELSEVTMPDFGKGYGADRVRYIGVTFADGQTALVDSFAELDEVLGTSHANS